MEVEGELGEKRGEGQAFGAGQGDEVEGVLRQLETRHGRVYVLVW